MILLKKLKFWHQQILFYLTGIFTFFRHLLILSGRTFSLVDLRVLVHVWLLHISFMISNNSDLKLRIKSIVLNINCADNIALWEDQWFLIPIEHTSLILAPIPLNSPMILPTPSKDFQTKVLAGLTLSLFFITFFNKNSGY